MIKIVLFFLFAIIVDIALLKALVWMMTNYEAEFISGFLIFIIVSIPISMMTDTWSDETGSNYHGDGDGW